jgi:hypothetical protein
MQRKILAVLAAISLAALACNINLDLPNVNVGGVETGPEQTVAIAEPAPEAGVEVVAVTLNMGAGQLNLTSGGSGLLAGEIRYNVADWEPTITNTGDTLIIEQGDDDDTINLPGGDDVINEWTLALGEVPMNLEVNAGAYEGNLALGGVPLRDLEINDGASSTTVTFDTPNPEEMDRLSYKTGASSVTLTGLANANFEDMNFDGGAGEFELDFSGDLQRDSAVHVTAGLGSVRIVVPAGTTTRVEVTGGLNDVNTQGSWTASGDVYETTGSGPTLTIEVDMGAGSLNLISQ